MVNGSNGNLIYVSIQYRLGLFGFLGGRDIALNVGLLDQRGGARLGAIQHPTFLRRSIKGHHLGWLGRERQRYLLADRR